jgi:long-subunit acyl-CoA synthetase (AMP-forming)
MITEYKSQLDNFLHWAKKTPESIYLKQPYGNKFKDYSYAESEAQIKKIASFIQKKLKQGPKHVGILSKNCAHWILSDLSIFMAGAISVPFYPTLSGEQLEQVLVHSDCQILIVGKLDHWEEIKHNIPKDVLILSTGEIKGETIFQWDDILATENDITTIHNYHPDDTITIVYTSGTTGTPKGVIIPAKSIPMAINVAKDVAFLNTPNTRFISYLPLCHIAERNFVEFAGTAAGGTIYFVENLNTFRANLLSANPTHFLAVPRIWAKFKEGILDKLGSDKTVNLLLSIPLINKLFIQFIKKSLGLDKTIMLITGAAPMPSDLLVWYQKFGLKIQEAYGMTENLGINTLMPESAVKLGTVGKPWNICEIRIKEETKEIQMYGEHITTGYYKEPELTKDLFDEKWLKTGDMGEIDQDGYLKIIGRVKDQFKTAKGNYVSPAPIENFYSQHPWIEQVCVIGLNLPQPIALILLNSQGLEENQALLTVVFEKLRKEINPHFKKYEAIAKVVVLSEDWTIENNCLTPTLKIKRPNVEKRYQANSEKWFNHKETIIFT